MHLLGGLRWILDFLAQNCAIDASGRQQEEGMKRFETALDMLCVQLEGMLQQ